jgi:alpha-aminoadipate carrier protein LysW
MVLSSVKCSDCDASIAIADDALKGEIVACPDCGLDFEVVAPGATPTIKALVIEKEDWGE